MAKQNLAFRIKIEIVETDAEPSPERCPQEHEGGTFSLSRSKLKPSVSGYNKK
jgi:hypothetical protein